MYVDPHNGSTVEADRPCVIELTPFASQKIADGLYELLVGNLPKEANDKDFYEVYKEFKDVDNGKNASVASYVSTFGLTETGANLFHVQKYISSVWTDITPVVQGPKGDTGATGANGTNGADGATGATGPAWAVWKGAYSSSATYSVKDAVQYSGSSFICKTSSIQAK